MESKRIHIGNRCARAVFTTAAYLLMVLWAYMAISKLAGHGEFVGVLSISPWVHYRWAAVMAWLLPGTFAMVFLLLAFPTSRRWGLFASTALLLFFVVYVAWMLIAIGQDRLPCSCGGLSRHLSWKAQLWVNITLTLLAAVASWLRIKHYTGLPP